MLVYTIRELCVLGLYRRKYDLHDSTKEDLWRFEMLSVPESSLYEQFDACFNHSCRMASQRKQKWQTGTVDVL